MEVTNPLSEIFVKWLPGSDAEDFNNDLLSLYIVNGQEVFQLSLWINRGVFFQQDSNYIFYYASILEHIEAVEHILKKLLSFK